MAQWVSFQAVGVVTPARTFENPNSGLRLGGLDLNMELWPEVLGAWFGRFDYSGRRFPIVGPLPYFYIVRFLYLYQFYTFIHIHAFYDRTVTAQ
jgi:hypothetical protein